LQDAAGNILAQSENSDGKSAKLTYNSPQNFKGFLVTTTVGADQYGQFELVISEVIVPQQAGSPSR
jgi:hypothetical protein